MSGTDPLVSIVVVNYNGADGLARCVETLAENTREPSAEILLVDNGSTDESLAIAADLAARLPAVRVLRSPENRGYAGAVNFALPSARGAYVAVMNMDLLVDPGWLGPLSRHLDANPDCGVACPLILLQEDAGTINAAGQDLHVTGLGFNRWLGEPRDVAGTEPFQVMGLHGAVFVIRRELLDRFDGWDERGFLYHEDVQLSWLLQLSGAEVHVVPASTVHHDYELSMSPAKLYLLERNRGAMVMTNLGFPTRVALLPFLAFTELLMWGYCLLRGPGFVRAKGRSYGWVISERRRIAERRGFIRSLRRRSDRQILRGLRWGYPWDQFFTLGRERGEARRNRLPS